MLEKTFGWRFHSFLFRLHSLTFFLAFPFHYCRCSTPSGHAPALVTFDSPMTHGAIVAAYNAAKVSDVVDATSTAPPAPPAMAAPEVAQTAGSGARRSLGGSMTDGSASSRDDAENAPRQASLSAGNSPNIGVSKKKTTDAAAMKLQRGASRASKAKKKTKMFRTLKAGNGKRRATRRLSTPVSRVASGAAEKTAAAANNRRSSLAR